MAENRGVWGIDIGQAGLKALRLRYAEAANQVIAVAFDYVPHPKILSQPDAIPEELIPQALETFLSRNDVSGDAIAISVPGQTALARFIQLPPVESSKVSEIVKYEARQQIPFALEDVIWDYQTLGGGTEESGFLLEAEVGLFAMKREQVLQHLKPFTDKKLEIDLIQIAPLALYNVLSYDQLGIRPGAEEGAQPPADEYYIFLDMGADNTTLLVSNGKKIWIRNVPIGGNHFTRALTKEMKLTFAKAEHLKCNATKSPDPRAVFQALRPVFNDYVSEIQRSIGYFSSVNRNAKIKKVVGIGNGFKLAGLQKFLQQNLQYEVERLDEFKGLVGDSVLGQPLFQENALSFAVPYGLALQALELTSIKTTLLPPEIKTARVIRRKKPWAAVAAAVLLFALMLSGVLTANMQRSVSVDRFGDDSTGAVSEVKRHNSTVASQKSQYDQKVADHGLIRTNQGKLLMPLETRLNWARVFKAIGECLPRDEGRQRDIQDIERKNRIRVVTITQQKVPDMGAWFTALSPLAKDVMLDRDKKSPPSGPGYVWVLECVHYHHNPRNLATGSGVGYARTTLLEQLKQWSVGATPVRVLGISHPTIVEVKHALIPFDPNAKESPGVDFGGFGTGGGFDAGDGGYGPGDGSDGAEDPGYGGGPGEMPMADAMPMPMDAADGYAPGLLDDPDAFGAPMGQPGGGIDTTNLGLTPERRDERRTIHETKFIVQFAWKPRGALEQAKFAVMKDLYDTTLALIKSTPADAAAGGAPVNVEEQLRSQFTAQAATEHLQKFEQLTIEERHKERLRRARLEITQEEFDEFLKRHTDLAAGTDPNQPQ
ncbi:MAG: type IV pilus assembly protein PilM [Planctomycetes bacterium]|nr:type IV pilus assembly protein PilM [Planctomycetota bacterium]